MSNRVVYGNSFSENGWPMVDQDSCVWVTVPGTNVHLQIREGEPAKILGAFVADWNAYIEPVRDADSACWTATNSVASSNHLSGTACDVCWNSHPFRVANAGFNAAQLATMNEMLDYYEDLVFWGNNWTTPKDAMHVQLNGDTYGAENFAKVEDFINRKIRADGFSTFRRDGTPPPPPPPPALSRADRYALLIIAEGRRRNITPRGIQIALATGLVESNITIYANAKVPASMNIPHDAVGSDGYSVGIFQQQVRDTGNGWWWGDAATCMDPTSSAGLFYDRLARLDYNNPARSPGSYAQAVQSSAFPGRYDERFGEAVALYNRLATTAPPTQGEDGLSAEAERMIREMHAEWSANKRGPSRSFMATDGSDVESPLGFLYNIDGNVWTQQLTWAYLFDVPLALEVVESVARNGSYSGSWVASNAFNAWLNEFGQAYCQGLVNFKKALVAKLALSAQQVTTVANNAAAPAPVADTRQLEAEITRLSEQFERLRIAVNNPPVPVSTEVAAYQDSTGDKIQRAVDSNMDYTDHVLGMDAAKRTALTRALQAIDPSNGDQA